MKALFCPPLTPLGQVELGKQYLYPQHNLAYGGRGAEGTTTIGTDRIAFPSTAAIDPMTIVDVGRPLSERPSTDRPSESVRPFPHKTRLPGRRRVMCVDHLLLIINILGSQKPRHSKTNLTHSSPFIPGSGSPLSSPRPSFPNQRLRVASTGKGRVWRLAVLDINHYVVQTTCILSLMPTREDNRTDV